MSVPLSARALPKLDREEVVDALRQPAGVRGFWTDEELLADAAPLSLPMLKKLQAMLWLMPGHIPIEGGGRRRAWVFREVVRAALVVEMADAANLAIMAVAKLLQRAPSDWLEASIRMDRRIAAAERERAGEPSPQEPAPRMIVLDMAEAWIEREPGGFELLSEGLALSGTELAVPPNRDLRKRVLQESGLVNSPRAILYLQPSNARLSFIGRVYEERGLGLELGR